MDAPLTIARVARAADVGIETVRYYERRGLIAQPSDKIGAYRRYDSKHVYRIRFIKRAQDLGFTLQEVEELLALEDGSDRERIRLIASVRLQDIRTRIADLKQIERTLAQALRDCETHAKMVHCPVISAIAP